MALRRACGWLIQYNASMSVTPKSTDLSSDKTTRSNALLVASNEKLVEQNRKLQAQVDWFKRQLFGRKSEKRLIDDEVTQQGLFTDSHLPARTDTEPTVTVPAYERKKAAHPGTPSDSGLRFDEEQVPMEVIELPSPELQGEQSDEYTVVSEKVTYRLAQRTGSYVILKYVRKVIKHLPTESITSPPAPENVLGKSYADVSFLVGLLIDKFNYHLPLYRQHQRLLDAGIRLSRSTLTHLVHRTAMLLKPIFDAQYQHVLLSRVLAMDETPIKAGRKKKGYMNQAYYWPIYGDADEVVFCYAATRAHRRVEQFLGEFEGTLLSDGYQAYQRYAEKRDSVTHATCWAHLRRCFEQAIGHDAGADQALDIIAALYRIEAEMKASDISREKKLQWRSEKSKPIVDDFFAFCQEQCQRHDLLPQDKFSKALNYAREREASSRIFLSDPDVQIDTNHLEGNLRPIPLGRRNWLFCWTEIGAEYVGIIQSLLVTCKLHNVNPYTYLVDVLQRISVHPAAAVEELTPRVWKEKFAETPLVSDVDRCQ